MSPWIDVGRYRVPLSSIRIGPKERAHHLSRSHRQNTPVTCLCTPQGVSMGVARRSDPQPTYYLYHLHRGDPTLHSPSCPHYLPAQEPPPHPPQPVQAPSPTPHHPDAAPPQDASPDAPASAALYLDRLIAAAGLNKWHPSFLDKRTFYRARFRLIEASKSVESASDCILGESLYFPPMWDPATKDLAEEEWRIFVEMLNAQAEAPHPFGYVLGLAKSLEVRPDWTAPRLLISSHNTPFWLDKNPALLPFPADKGNHWLVLLQLAPSRSRHGYRVSDAAAVLLSSRWIPCFTSAHAKLADELAQSNLSFTASLSHDVHTSWAIPDFIVQAPDGHTYRHGLFGATRVAPFPLEMTT